MPRDPQDELSYADAVAVLRWHADFGVDAVLDDAPHDRFAQSARETRTTTPATAGEPPRAASPAVAGPAIVTADEAIEAARALAASAATLAALREAIAGFEGCYLRATATHLVFGAGARDAPLLLTGDIPNAEADLEGAPFLGDEGTLLDNMLAAIGLNRAAAFLTNVAPWRPPGGSLPLSPLNAAICRIFLDRQIELVRPRVVVALGGEAAQMALGAKGGILSARGRWVEFQTPEWTCRAVATLHPAFLLKSPSHKKLAWADLRAIRAALEA